jgi:hypothetical protein
MLRSCFIDRCSFIFELNVQSVKPKLVCRGRLQTCCIEWWKWTRITSKHSITSALCTRRARAWEKRMQCRRCVGFKRPERRQSKGMQEHSITPGICTARARAWRRTMRCRRCIGVGRRQCRGMHKHRQARNLGVMYDKGAGVEKDAVQAVH